MKAKHLVASLLMLVMGTVFTGCANLPTKSGLVEPV